MYSEDQIYAFVEWLIDESAESDALFEADSDQRLRFDISEKTKIVRVECFAGNYFPNSDAKEEELDVSYDIEFLVLPSDQTDSALKSAKTVAWEMYKQFKAAILNNPYLNTGSGGTVCDADAREKAEIGEVLMNGSIYAVALGGGKINRTTEE
jgi:hypothetical protein